MYIYDIKNKKFALLQIVFHLEAVVSTKFISSFNQIQFKSSLIFFINII